MLALNRWKAFFVLSLSILGLLASLPPFFPGRFSLPSWLPQKQLVLGLDLQGGAHLLLEVDEKKLLEDRCSLLLDSTRKLLRTEKIGYLNLLTIPQGVRFELRDKDEANDVLDALEPLATEVKITVSGTKVVLMLTPQTIETLSTNALEKSIETIRRRVDETGTKEPVIQRQGKGRIILQVPGLSDPQRLRELIGKTARLSFQLVEQVMGKSEASSFVVPPGKELLPAHRSEGENEMGGDDIFYLVDREVLLSGDMLVDAHPESDDFGRPVVAFKFNNMGSDRFSQVTQENVGRQFAIVLDEEVASAPQIKQPILGGTGIIQGSFTIQQTQDLSLLMRSGSLPAPLVVLEERTVGPGLGSDSIRQGTEATIFAIIAVAILMFLAYSAFAVFANLAIFFNVALLITCLVYLGASLTLPGIAGIALTVGMAVDANVLINERIREELRLGRKVAQAIDLGYQRALTTIIDSNLTTLLGACLLYYFGTGSVRGFAVTLSLGIIISMFTAVSLTRVLVTLWVKARHPKTLWM